MGVYNLLQRLHHRPNMKLLVAFLALAGATMAMLPPRRCPPTLCGCPHGMKTVTYTKDNGCEACKCAPDRLPYKPELLPPRCPAPLCICAPGQKASLYKGADGCSKCKCKHINGLRPRCPAVKPVCGCPPWMKTAYSKDSFGCKKCTCVPSRRFDIPLREPLEPLCPETMCRCPSFLEVITYTENGCDKCKCGSPRRVGK